MLKGLFGFVISVAVLIVVGLYVAYGEIEPCKVLAVEQSRRAGHEGVVAGTVDRMTSSTDGMSTSQCVGGLLDSWADRIKSD